MATQAFRQDIGRTDVLLSVLGLGGAFPQDMQSIEMRQIAKTADNTGNPFPQVKDPAKSPWPQARDF